MCDNDEQDSDYEFGKLYKNAHSAFKCSFNLSDDEDGPDLFPKKQKCPLDSLPAKVVINEDIIDLLDADSNQAIVINDDNCSRITRSRKKGPPESSKNKRVSRRQRKGQAPEKNQCTEHTRITVISDSESEMELDKSKIVEENINYVQTVLVKWKYETFHKISLRRFQKLSVIREELSALENVKPDSIMLTLNDKHLDPTECLHSLDITVKDIIDALPMSSEVEAPKQYYKAETCEPILTFKVQLKNSRKPIFVTLKQSEKLSIIFEKLREELNGIPLSKLKLRFDGDILSPSMTAGEQDLEGGECLDLAITEC